MKMLNPGDIVKSGIGVDVYLYDRINTPGFKITGKLSYGAVGIIIVVFQTQGNGNWCFVLTNDGMGWVQQELFENVC